MSDQILPPFSYDEFLKELDRELKEDAKLKAERFKVMMDLSSELNSQKQMVFRFLDQKMTEDSVWVQKHQAQMLEDAKFQHE